MRRKNFVLLLAVAVSGVCLGCSSYTKWEYERARRAERQGKPQLALYGFQKVLSRVPADDKRWRSETYFHIGECLWTLDRPSEAFTAFQKAADADESNVAAHLQLGEIYLAGGAPNRASEQAHAALQQSSGNTEALALLGAAASALGNPSLAETAFRRVLQSDPKHVQAAVALAELYHREDRLDDARKVLRAAANAQPKSALPWLFLGHMEEQAGDAAAAEADYRKAVSAEDSFESNLRLAQFLQRSSRIREAEQVLRRADGLRPDLPVALADFQLTSGRIPEALERYLFAMRSPALQLGKDEATLTWTDKSKSHVAENRVSLAARIIEADIQEAYAARRGGDPGKAMNAAAQHMMQFGADLDPATAAVLKAEIALAGNDLQGAVKHASYAVRLAPQSAAAHYVLGIVKQRAGEPLTARREWLVAFEADSTFVPARLALAAEALRDWDAAGAEQFVLPVVREEPSNVRALALFARALAGEKQYASASVIARRLAAVDEGSADPHIILAEIAAAQSQFAKALIEYEQAIVLEPRSSAAIDGLTRLYRHGAVTRPMLRKLEAAAGRKPQSATLMEIAGRLYAEHGWYGDAQRCLQRALQLDPHRATAAAALAQAYAAVGKTSAATASAAMAGGRAAAVFSGFAAQQRNEVSRGIREYEAAMREGENSGVAANNLAWLYAQQGRLDQALALAQKARSLAPKNPAVLDTVGLVHLRRREYSKAIEVLKSAALMLKESQGSTERATRKTETAVEQSELAAAIRRHLAEAYLRAGVPEDLDLFSQAGVEKR
ncbi:MAG: tetratricopeptide repeat protein [Terriglobales bacterium]